MIIIEIFIALLCSSLFWIGGAFWLPARRFILPTILTLTALYLTHFDWYCFSMLSAMGVFCLGYGDKSPLRHCFGDGWGRGIWGLLGAITLSLALFLTGHLSISLLLPYLALNFTLENALKKISQSIGDPIIGVGFSCVIFLIH